MNENQGAWDMLEVTAQNNNQDEESPVSRQEARSALSRRKLLEATIHIIRTKGVAKLNVRAICKEAGLTTGAFYHLFNSKEDVINYYLSYAFNRYKQEAKANISGLSATEKIRNIYRYFVRMCKEAGYEFMRVYYTPANTMLNFRERPNNERVVLEECVDYLLEGQRDGTIRPDIDLDAVRLEIAMIATGVMFYWCVFEGKLDAEEILDQNLKTYLATLEV